MEAAGSIVEDKLEHALLTLPPVFNALNDDGAADGGGDTGLQFGHASHVPTIIVTARPVQEEVFDGLDPQARKLSGAFGAHTAQGRHGQFGEGRRSRIHAALIVCYRRGSNLEFLLRPSGWEPGMVWW